jgi:hypothetical protein
MKEYTITLKISIEAQNNIDLENINDFADELIETITEQSTNSIIVNDVTIDNVADLNDDMLDDYDDYDEEIEEW